jgi:hypothetical protein
MRKRPTPTYNYRRAAEQKNAVNGSWKSEHLAISSRERLRPDDHLVRSYCQRLGLDAAFRPELNTVASMSSLPTVGENELVRYLFTSQEERQASDIRMLLFRSLTQEPYSNANLSESSRYAIVSTPNNSYTPHYYRLYHGYCPKSPYSTRRDKPNVATAVKKLKQL